jgi:flagellar biosynthesis/type III secretory pathway protein FliH
MSEAVENTSSDVEVTALRRLEIESLLRSSREATYQRSVSAPRKAKGFFAKTPLIELARQAQQREDTKAMPDPAGTEMPAATSQDIADGSPTTEASSAARSEENVPEADVSDALSALDSTDDVAAAAASFEADQADTGAEIDQNLMQDAEAVENPILEPDLSSVDKAAEQIEFADGNQTDQGDQIDAAVMADDAQANASYDRGFAEGQAAAKAELAEVTERFVALVTALSADNRIASEALETELRQAVLHIASERAGMAISDMPELFATKIRRLTQMVDQAGQKLTISLNAEDLDAIRPYLEQATPPLTAQLVADDKKLRGDIEIHAGAISVRDMLIERGEIADADRFEEIGRVMRDLISDADVVTDTDAEPAEAKAETEISPSAPDNTDTDQ